MSQNLAQRIPWIDCMESYGAHIIEKFLQKAAPFTTVLDIGCGSGRDLDIAQSICPQAIPIAIEHNVDSIASLTKKGFLCHVCNIENESIPLKNESTDIIIANQVLEHVKEIFWIVHEMMRIVRIGGHMLIGVPNVASLHNRISLLFGKHPSQAKLRSAHVRIFSKHDTLHFFESIFPHGVTLTAFAGSQFYPFPRRISRALADIFPASAVCIFFLLQKTRAYNGEFVTYVRNAGLETNFWQGPEFH